MHADATLPLRRVDRRLWVRWLATFVGFPLAGLAAKAAAGPIDSTAAGLVGGLAGGAVLGAVQSLALRRSATERMIWVASTAGGLAVGLAVGARVVDFRTDTASLVVLGLASGAGVGLAQALVLRGRVAARLVWAASTTALWGLGWLITSQVIVDTDSQYATFGASGALVATVLGGAVLAAGRCDPNPARPTCHRNHPISTHTDQEQP